jgi:preprotein translocase subunit SecE
MSAATDEKTGFFRRIPLFLRQVSAELRKVVWPTKQQLVTYTSVVIVFVILVAILVSILDLAFARLMLFVFG